MILAAGWVFETAISAMSPAFRPTRRAALAMRSWMAERLEAMVIRAPTAAPSTRTEVLARDDSGDK